MCLETIHSPFALTCADGGIRHTQCAYGCGDNDGGVGCLSRSPVCDCFGATCGDNGCGGSCGTCATDEKCTAQRVCVPTVGCGRFAAAPGCIGHQLATCVSSKLHLRSCPDEGKVCGQDGCRGGVDDCIVAAGQPCDQLPAIGHCGGLNHFFSCGDAGIQVRHCDDELLRCSPVGVDGLGCTASQ